MDMNRAAVFARVVEAKGFSAAGRALAMPKTTVSKKVADLEAELGVRLLNRTTRAVSPTEAGARVHAHVVAALRHMADAEAEARAIQSEPAGMLTIAAPGAIGVPFLMPAVLAFLDRHPAIEATLLSVNERVDLDAGEADVLIWADAATPPGHAVRLVARVEMALYASPAYAARRGPPDTPAELAAHDVVAFIQAFIAGRFVWQLRRDGGEIRVEPERRPILRSNDAAAVLAGVRAGSGIGGLPVRLAAEAGGDLLPVLPGWSLPPVELSALFRDGRASSAKTRLFLDFAAEWFRAR